MQQVITLLQANENHISKTNVFTRFYEWTVRQEERRIMWLAFVFLLQIGVALPCTLFCVATVGGNNFNLWLTVCVVNVPSFALNLAAQPTKVTLPVLFFAWLADAIVIIYTLTSFFVNS